MVGDSGAGKSTLVFALVEGGHELALLSDDCLPIDVGEDDFPRSFPYP